MLDSVKMSQISGFPVALALWHRQMERLDAILYRALEATGTVQETGVAVSR